MDLKNLIPASDTVVIELEYKGNALTNEDGTPMTVEVYLPHAKEYKETRHRQSDFIISKGEQKLKSAEYEDLGYSFIVDTTKGWNITFGEDEETKEKIKPKFSKKKAREVFEALPFIPELIRKKVDEQEAFI